jgi:nucleoside 2-deoxyribosyltransferase
MKVYLAARYSRYPEMQGVAAILEGAGHTVTSRWVKGDHQCNDDQLANTPGWALKIAIDDVFDLTDADCLVLFTDPLRTPTRGGKQVELGMALALGKRVIIVGQPENVFQYLPRCEREADLYGLYERLGVLHG